MSCQEIQDDLVRFVLGELPEEREREVVAHLDSQCSGCNAELRAIDAGMNELFDSVQSQEVDETEVAQIRMAATRASVGASALNSGRDWVGDASNDASRSLFTSPSAIYALAFAAGIILTMTLLPIAGLSTDADKTLEQNRRLAMFQDTDGPGPSLSYLTLQIDESVAAIWGQTVHDHVNGELHFFAREIPDAPPGRSYGLVMIDVQGNRVLGQVLSVDKNRRAKAVVKIPSTEKLRAIAIQLVPDSAVPGSRVPVGPPSI